MILVLLVISAVAFFISFIYTDNPISRRMLTLISGAVVLLSLLAIVANYYDHYGLHKVSVTSTKKIYSADQSSSMNLILYQKIGTSGKENVYIYSTKLKQKTPQHTQADEYTTNKVKNVSSNTAKLKTTKTYWEYKSNASKFWFGIAGNGHELVKRVNNFEIPKTWIRLSTSQAKELKKELADSKFQQQVKKEAAAYVEEKMKAAVIKDPSLATNKVEQEKMEKQLAAKFQSEMIKKLISKLK
ncbi:DUF4811 domain-containing protein [Oenococcus oeni]|uniref:DUF4811 domain-containing protein n=1 Tax=Oenococcus oeni TaxID=1247 RepID=A0A6N4A6X7_OENOE|nr:DUF4811 domain-containing protein [Oenococcus oeni]OIK57072.1 DUF4811 domain-containing protein [Oenococcus oeni]OIL38316.1 DUF4811 domain-containing protein [Oenococcus oeni]OIM21374.1 DUF4811 domain-containing protein [Oenococcus oeni]OIM23625.1 DUF4811 domain-containing protein [Oenococcus oeni]OIM26877.1 DUF4811 domain-containing protein [Oenococcus oeni]